MVHDSGVRPPALRVDGGMVRNELLMQFQADVLGLPVVRATVPETTALGAAFAAGLAVGVWRDLEELRGLWSADRAWHPVMSEAQREALYRRWLRAVERTFDWAEE
jgi:glycerol kinase